MNFLLLLHILSLILLTKVNGNSDVHLNFMNMIKNKSIEDQYYLWHISLGKQFSKENINNFYLNIKKIETINSKEIHYKLGLGPFADMSYQDFSNKYLTKLHQEKLIKLKNDFYEYLAKENTSFKNDIKISKGFEYFDEQADIIANTNFRNKEIINEVDYDSKEIKEIDNFEELKFLSKLKDNNVSSKDWSYLYPSIKDQLMCGSCWAFSTIGVLEAFYVIQKNKDYVALSEQQLIDCTGDNAGCFGGWYEDSFKYLKENLIIDSKSYPYIMDKKSCKIDGKYGLVKLQSYIEVEEFNKDNEKIISNGPYSSAIYVNEEFMLYVGGIFEHDCTQKDNLPNHAVIVVQITEKYIKIRNSWGNKWGENGYMRVKRNINNNFSCFLEQIIYQPTNIIINIK